MGDLAKDASRAIDIKKLEQRKLQLAVNRMSMEIRIAEIDEEKRRILENFPLYDTEVKELDDKIKELSAPVVDSPKE